MIRTSGTAKLRAAIALSALLLACVLPSYAQDFPSSPLRIVSPAPAGGTLDSAIRILSEKVFSLVGQRLVIESKTGASGNIAAEIVARSVPDGYTLLLGYDAIHVTNPHVFRNLTYDPTNDFLSVIQIGSFPVALVVRNDFPAKSFEEFVQYVRLNPEKVNFGTPGIGSTHHLAAEVLGATARIKMTHIPYKGADGIAIDVAGGRLDAGFFSLASALKVVTSGQGRMLALAEPKRLPTLPDIPVFSELYPGAVVQSWFGILAPKGTPVARIAKIENSIADSLKDPAVVTRLTAIGVVITGLRSAAFTEAIRTDYEKRGLLIKKLNIRSE